MNTLGVFMSEVCTQRSHGVLERWSSGALEISGLQVSGLALEVQARISNRLVSRRRSTTLFKPRSSTP